MGEAVGVGGIQPHESEDVRHTRSALFARAEAVSAERVADDRADSTPGG